ncbi:HDL436Wp [Eremothecium sinecaudum]|uniref:HDL436Wp n=1 Tax=Eremothecium sinecaudum TaxID=45286 RepID=A0A109UYZ0_9SACH|nr:HDL436Wp [Eremothecium sinecaudum]AMD20308.1 HDL436Wp [Eremothecium sinecaudum]
MDRKAPTGSAHGISMSEEEYQKIQQNERQSRGQRNEEQSNDSAASKRNSGSSKSKEKRKSEVMIAAQSLDHELQNVKNLKRLSIGSMDLLVDPEMEFRVQATPPATSNSSSCPSEEVSGVETLDSNVENANNAQGEEADNSYSIGDENREDYMKTFDSDEQPEGSDVLSCALKRSSSTVRKGVLPSNRSKLEKPKKAKYEAGLDGIEPISKNLLWVRADQHPNVKPENYLELVNDTLNNLQLDGLQGRNGRDSIAQSSNSRGLSKSPDHNNGDSLVKRPSRLRKSYTEGEGLQAYNYSEQSEEEDSPKRPNSTSSLKEITEELTRISNNAGLTDSDAITLARTLSIGTSTIENSLKHSAADSNSKNDEDNEFASNIVTKNGLTIPPRSSLRRSKFNTYRMRSNRGTKFSRNSPAAAANKDKNVDQELAEAGKKNIVKEVKISRSHESLASLTSQTSINDIYDHYNTTDTERYSTDSSSPGCKFGSQVESPEQVSGLSGQSDVSLSPLSSTSSTDLHDKLLPGSSASQQTSVRSNPPQTPPKDYKRIIDRKKPNWNWLSTYSPNSSDADPTNTSEEDSFSVETSISEDFAAIPVSTPKSSELVTRKVNHSRHRHQNPYNEQTSTDQAKPHTHEPIEQDSAPVPRHSSLKRKEKLEKQFMKIFKKKTVNFSSEELSNPTPTDGEVTAKGNRDTKKKSSNKKDTKRKSIRLSNFRGDSKSPANSRKQTTAPTSPVITKQDEITSDPTKSLKPAVNVTSSKLVQLPEPAEDVPAEINPAPVQEKEPMELYSNQNNLLPGRQAEVENSLPPRKLTFDDAVRPEHPNAPMKFTPSAFGFPLPPLTASTVIMFDHRLPIFVERAIYRLSHLKLSDPKRELRQQVLLSNFMYSYLNLVNHSLYLQQVEEENSMVGVPDA